MSADLLREAAALMRERAEAAASAIGDEWRVRDVATLHSLHFRTADGDWRNAFECGPCAAWDETPGPKHEYVGGAEEVAEHIASWHPAVALAVAKALDDVADAWEICSDDGEWALDPDYFPIRFEETIDGGWLAVARAYVGSGS